MGQSVEIRNTVTMGDVLMLDTDRSFTGQDGQAIGQDLDGEGVPGVLAQRLFGLGLGIDHVWVLQNTVTVRRPGGWDEDTATAVTETTHSFLRFYERQETQEAEADQEITDDAGADEDGTEEE